MSIEREWLLIAWATVLTAWVIWKDIAPLVYGRPKVRMSKDERKAWSDKLLALSDRSAAVRRKLPDEGFGANESVAYDLYRVCAEFIAAERYLSDRGIPTLKIHASERDDIRQILFWQQRYLLAVGTQIAALTDRDFLAYMRNWQDQIYNHHATHSQPMEDNRISA